MALPLTPIPAQLAPDDVRSAELVSDIDRFAADSVDHFRREHLTHGRDKGRHDVVTVFSAVARAEFPTWAGAPGRAPEPNDLQLRWAFGFERAPSLVIGTHPLFSPQFSSPAVYLSWKIAETRAYPQLVALTPVWTGSGLPTKLLVRTYGAEGAVHMGFAWTDPDTGRQGIHPDLRSLVGLTIGIHALIRRV